MRKTVALLLAAMLLLPCGALAAKKKTQEKAEILFAGLQWGSTLKDVQQAFGEGGKFGRAGYPVTEWMKDSAESLLGYATYTDNGLTYRVDYDKGGYKIYENDVREISFVFSKIPQESGMPAASFYEDNPEQTVLLGVRVKFYTGFEKRAEMNALTTAVNAGLTAEYGRVSKTDKLDMGKIVKLLRWDGGRGTRLFFLSEASNRFCELTYVGPVYDDMLLNPRDPAKEREAEEQARAALRGKVLILGSGTVNVRASAGQKGKKVGAVKTGDYLELVSVADNGWLEIRMEDGKTGFISPKMGEIQQ